MKSSSTSHLDPTEILYGQIASGPAPKTSPHHHLIAELDRIHLLVLKQFDGSDGDWLEFGEISRRVSANTRYFEQSQKSFISARRRDMHCLGLLCESANTREWALTKTGEDVITEMFHTAPGFAFSVREEPLP